jgi:uncharacterized protein YjbJ (UPF0337 family)
MSLEERAKATGKDIEGKVQEGIGEVTGSDTDRVEGKAKQGEAEVRHNVEGMKEKATEVAENVKDRVQSAGKNIAGKVEEAIGKVTDDPAKVAEGKAKQL